MIRIIKAPTESPRSKTRPSESLRFDLSPEACRQLLRSELTKGRGLTRRALRRE